MKYLRKFNSLAEMQAAIQADNVSFIGLAQPEGQEPTMNVHVHVYVPPTDLTITCSDNTVTISATNADTIQYKLGVSGEYVTYTTPFEITETVTVYAKASNADGYITGSQECVYSEYGTPFYIEDISGSTNIVTISQNSNNAPALSLEKSTDGTTWETIGTTSYLTPLKITMQPNSRLYLRPTRGC